MNQHPNTYAVELKEVVKSFGTVTAVNHVNLEIEDGEIFSLLGPSGCGKTTLLRIVAGFETPDSGQVMIQGQPMNNVPPPQPALQPGLSAIGLVPPYERGRQRGLWPPGTQSPQG